MWKEWERWERKAKSNNPVNRVMDIEGNYTNSDNYNKIKSFE